MTAATALGILTATTMTVYAFNRLNNLVEARQGRPPLALPDELRFWAYLSIAFLAAFIVALILNPH